MSIRRLARLSQSATTGLQTTNWTTQATETYDANNPGAAPSSWGTTPEIANLDRDFDKTGSLKQHLGILLTITDAPDNFWGAQAKLQVTYGPTDDPQLELWTHDTTNGWVKRRRLDVPILARSGDTVLFDLILGTSLVGVDQVWITLVPTTTETNNWLEMHLYGDCNTPLVTPDCPPLSDPPDCSLTHDGCPDGSIPPCPPTQGGTYPPPDPPTVPTTFPLPPITVEVLNPPVTALPTTITPGQFTHTAAGKWFTPCPGPTRIRMYFSIRAGGQIVVSVLNSGGVLFTQGFSQTVSGDSFIDWTVSSGFHLTTSFSDSLRGPFLFPRALIPSVTFLFTPSVNFSILDFFDWEQFLWTYDVLSNSVGGEFC